MAFEENVKRAHLQATIWQTALNTGPPDIGSYDYVWLKYDHFKSLQPKTIPHDQQFAPSVILKITQCLCATNQPYSLMRCSCTSWMFNFMYMQWRTTWLPQSKNSKSIQRSLGVE